MDIMVSLYLSLFTLFYYLSWNSSPLGYGKAFKEKDVFKDLLRLFHNPQ